MCIRDSDKSAFDYMDVSPKMVFSVATALIPFLQNDDPTPVSYTHLDVYKRQVLKHRKKN